MQIRAQPGSCAGSAIGAGQGSRACAARGRAAGAARARAGRPGRGSGPRRRACAKTDDEKYTIALMPDACCSRKSAMPMRTLRLPSSSPMPTWGARSAP